MNVWSAKLALCYLSLLIREIGLVDCNVAVLKEKRTKGSSSLRALLIRIFHYHSPHDEVRILNLYWKIHGVILEADAINIIEKRGGLYLLNCWGPLTTNKMSRLLNIENASV